MSSNYVLVSRFPLKNNISTDIFSSLKSTERKRYYFCEEPGVNEFLELRSFNDIKEISWVEEEIYSMFHNFADVLSADIRRELLKFVESPIDNENDLPETQYIQLRHVEVPAHNYQQYRQWRDETIFNVVRDNKDKIQSFEAFHSLISGVPGVMFISAFNGNKEDYKKPFTNARYQEIIQQAGDNYITGGNEGLYTRIYRAC
ncbi:hypothetical protein EHN07_03840 [Buttiauxella warmboldiae]|uniref:Uncharacterized protein n=1 Tax=Buttiauxella warmboldiae TaxID=82993 RepID=A0A3N5ECH3_9ENTR|nr:hypothetical protein [Buttiauxella warmboldiae]RPH30243.1 hypothetical protein EHN07_03840 [Buttiauxella warmboldiae]